MGFNELKSATSLFGEEYLPIIKALWYSLVSCVNTKVEVKLNQVTTDGRIHILFFIKSGKGKKELKRVIKSVVPKIQRKGYDKECEEPTALHPERLVGKVSKIREKGEYKYYPTCGDFTNDFLIIDEGHDLLTSTEQSYLESRRYMRLALDPYPYNDITKRAVDIPKKEQLKYKPYCNFVIFTQPNYMSEAFATDGDLRRFIVPYVNMTGIDRKKAYEHRVSDKTNTNESLNKFIAHLNCLKDFTYYTIPEDVEEEFNKLHYALASFGFNFSPKVRNFTDIYDFTIQDILLKMASVQALQDGTNIIDVKHVSLAFIDLAEFLYCLFNFIDSKILGSMDYGETWNGATDKDKELLRFLYDNGATSREESTVSIADYKEKIKEVFEVGERQSIRINRKHEENGWIGSKKGKHDSKVWLNFNPDVKTVRGDMSLKQIKILYQEKLNLISQDDMSSLSPLEDDQCISYDVLSGKSHTQNSTFQNKEDIHSKTANPSNPGALEASEQLIQQEWQKEQEIDYKTIPVPDLDSMMTFEGDSKAYDELKRRGIIKG